MESKTYSEKVDEWLFSKSGCHIIDFCRKFGYYPIAQKIMELDEHDEKKSKAIMSKDSELKALYISASKDDFTISRKGKNRSFTGYFKHIITGWVVEDLVMTMLKEQGIDIVHNGHDENRKICIGKKDVTQDADFRITVGNVVRKIELTGDYNNVLCERGFIEKRAPSLIKTWRDKGIWLYRDLSHGKYVLVDFATEKVKLHLRNHNTISADWSKDVHRYVLEENGKKIRDEKLLAAEIISVVGCSIDGKEQPQIDEVIDEDSPPIYFELGGNRRNAKSNVETGIAYPGVVRSKNECIKPLQKERYAEGASLGTLDKAIQKSRMTGVEAEKVKKPENQKPKVETNTALINQPTPTVSDDYDDGSESDVDDWESVDLGDEDFV